jgi:hypothetical protein
MQLIWHVLVVWLSTCTLTSNGELMEGGEHRRTVIPANVGPNNIFKSREIPLMPI